MASVEGTYDVIVVGAGIMGSCIAYEIAKRGNSVLLIEQFDLLHRRGSSHGESRTLRLTYPEDYYTLMATRSLQLWQNAEKEAGYEVYTRTGQLDIGHSSNEGIKQVISSCIKHKVSHQVLDQHPTVKIPAGSKAVYTHEAGVLKATKSVAMFQMLALKHGAIIRDKAKVISISYGWNGKSTLVATSRGSALATKRVVLAAGAWISELIQTATGAKNILPITPVHTFIFYWKVEDEAAANFSNNFPSFADYGATYIYGTPCLEYPGLLKVSIHGGYPCDPNNRNHAISYESIKPVISSWIASTFEGKVKSDAPTMVEGCMYSMTPDQDFILDFLPGSHDNVLVAAGFSGHGFKMGPVVGKIMGDLALDASTNEDIPLEFFSLSRFQGGRLGNHKNFDPVQEIQKLML